MKKKHAFALLPAQVIAKCAANGHRPICAGNVLALQWLLVEYDWSLEEASERMDIGRTTLSDILSLRSIPSMECMDCIAEAFEMKLWEYHCWSGICLDAQWSE